MTRWICLVVILAGLSGCGTLSAVSDATESLDAFTLSPAQQTAAVGGRLHIVVPPPTAGGAIATDRILVKPNRLQAAYLPGGRWVDPAPILIQSLVVASLQNSGGFRLVGRDDAGLSPDLTLLLDLTRIPGRGSCHRGRTLDGARCAIGDAGGRTGSQYRRNPPVRGDVRRAG